MELREATNFFQLQRYVNERQNRLWSFEDQIIHRLYIYFQEEQIFFFLKDFTLPWNEELLKVKYQDWLVGHNVNDVKVGCFDKNGQLYLKVFLLNYWMSCPILDRPGFYRWIPHYDFVDTAYPYCLYKGTDYEEIYSDASVLIVSFRKKLEPAKYAEESGKRRFSYWEYRISPENKSKVLRESSRYLTYSSCTHQETYQQLDINKYFRLSSYYEEQEKLLKRELLKSFKS